MRRRRSARGGSTSGRSTRCSGALDLESGEEIWRIKGRYEFPTGATVVDGGDGEGQRVVVNGYDGITRCLRARDGEEIWQFETADYLFGTPAVIDGEWVTYGGCDAMIRKLRLSDGESAVEWEIDAQVTTTVATYDGVVFACSYGQEVVAVDVRAGKLKWIHEAEDLGLGSAPGVDERAVYLGGEGKVLHAIDRETGKGLWKFKAGGSIEVLPWYSMTPWCSPRPTAGFMQWRRRVGRRSGGWISGNPCWRIRHLRMGTW